MHIYDKDGNLKMIVDFAKPKHALLFYILRKLIYVLVFTALVFIIIYFLRKGTDYEQQTIKRVAPATCIGTDGLLTDAIRLSKPIPVVWNVRFGECLVSGCNGATFTKEINDGIAGEYSDFIGYYDDNYMPQQFLKKELDLKVYGNWEFLGGDKDATGIHNRCVPLIMINKVEQI